jgi:ArsR family transcriptional regulator, nickel/cobalt-responsive transcriptional repressor
MSVAYPKRGDRSITGSKRCRESGRKYLANLRARRREEVRAVLGVQPAEVIRKTEGSTLNPAGSMPKPKDDPKAQAAWLGGIAEPTRMAILRVLAVGDKTVTELAQACGTEIVNVSHHLNLLKGIGIVSAEREGRFMRYSLVGATTTATLLELTHESGVKVVIPLG